MAVDSVFAVRMSTEDRVTTNDASRDRSVVRDYYSSRDQDQAYERQWGYVNPVAAAYWRLRDELVFERVLSRFDPLSRSLRVLEVGSGNGHEIAKLGLLGVSHTNLFGVDLMGNRVRRAQETYPQIKFSEQDATQLDFPDESFDIVLQYTCAMHADSRETLQRMCSEMMRVTRPGGIILWWDIAPMRWSVVLVHRLLEIVMRPWGWRQNLSYLQQSVHEAFSVRARRLSLDEIDNKYIRPTAPEELQALFPGMSVIAMQAGLDFDIWAPVWRHWRGLAEALWRWHCLPRHCFAVIAKPPTAVRAGTGSLCLDRKP